MELSFFQFLFQHQFYFQNKALQTEMNCRTTFAALLFVRATLMTSIKVVNGINQQAQKLKRPLTVAL